MNSPPSSSSSTAFERLHPEIQKWIWEQGWTSFRDAQERAAPLLLDGDRDLIISASTASGKTEAAFLPILTKPVSSEPQGMALYVSPLKALINDQWGRLTALCERLGLPGLSRMIVLTNSSAPRATAAGACVAFPIADVESGPRALFATASL